ncbi:alanine--tRNA ligase [Alkaliphilus metalliredigens]|uniref:Alanine--tRNA ligase n=1 Tax=Alkaliphilus metalliredigens (strain QYMF) TaxID=293826 RepID=SYA_ALKMQ|nr:alanine--tRNA ligase [Alkaliphilus metalliredigens]A6TQZ4.2 RecName: Full=Alanine--tRNA ligase; AltName: Full=Alanyl-tRNA synthetase; Short=AlaRS [Alkaliphilus metalliredigens QYMF]
MKKMGLNEIRKLFLDFYEEKEHYVQSSYPLVPHNDKSLLLINAGMAPLKNYFSGVETPPSKRMATCQKCIRTGDIENVGKTSRHATFFEMLGSFAFGDYFKTESIQWGWEFATKYLEMPEDKIWASVYEEDDEAYGIWENQIKMPKERIVRLGKEDNFWEIGVGPCGPCSELYFDRGDKYSCGHDDCKPGCDCDRFVEFWNHVFTQFDKDEAGNYNLLPNPNIDTGMGLERVACIMQDVDSIFEVDTMKHILNSVCTATNTQYNKDVKTNISLRIITDHLRSITFMIGDGILPSNEGRGYVLRRLLRRAARHGKLLGVSKSFLYELMDTVTETYGGAYSELVEKKDYIKKIIQVEEDRFQETIHQGLEILNQHIEEMIGKSENMLNGTYAFKLYDTYGFPLDLTKEILEEREMTVDESEFESEMEKQRNRARKARSGGDTEGWKEDAFDALDKNIQTSFKGYETLRAEGKVLAIIEENQSVNLTSAGKEVVIVLDKTPFYPESGGQIGDIGHIFKDEFEGQVLDTKQGKNQRIHQYIKILRGILQVGDSIQGEVDKEPRHNTERNHTATHLLHKALKGIIGEHVEQAGSLVTPEKLRFDFSHFEGLSSADLSKVELEVNQEILNALNVDTVEASLEEAKKMGAMALFGEKYGDDVRVVKTGDYSVELCGGTHVKNSSEIGTFLILSETGVAAGVRRIEAVTGQEAYHHIKREQGLIQDIESLLKTKGEQLTKRVEELLKETKEKDKELQQLKSKLANQSIDEILNQIEVIEGTNLLVHHFGEQSMEDLRNIGDSLKQKIGSGVIALGAESNDKASFFVTATKDVVEKGVHSGNMIREVAKIAGGGGGGRPDMAQAGGKNPEKIQSALSIVKGLLKNQLNG